MTIYKAQSPRSGGENGTAKQRENMDILNQFGKRVLPLLTLKRHTPQRSIKNPCGGVAGGYNSISLKNWQYAAPDNGGFVLPSDNGAMRSHMRSCTRTALGVLASGNAPADQFGESTPTLTVVFNSQKLEANMAKSTSCATAQPFKKINLSFEASAFGMARVTFENLDFTENDLQANRKRIIKAFKQACLSGRGILDKDLYKPLEAPIAYYAGNTIIKPWEVGFTLDAVQCTNAVIDSKADAIMQRIAVELNEYHAQTEGGAL